MDALGLCMIVKNESRTMGRCLKSVRGIVDQIVIGDTGSSDDTCDVAREFGATVVSVRWEDDFSKARNAVLEFMRTEWVLVLDADEEADRESAKNLSGLLRMMDMGGFQIPIRNYVRSKTTRAWDRISRKNDCKHERATNAPAFVTNENCRLFRRRHDIFFTGRVHELVEPQILAAGLKLGFSNFFIHHFGHFENGLMSVSKNAYYRDLLRLETNEVPKDPRRWIQLGIHLYRHFSDRAEALVCLQRAIALDPEAFEAWLFLALIYVDDGKYAEALRAIDHDRRIGFSLALREQIKGDAFQGMGRLEDARAAYRAAIEVHGDDVVLESKLGYVEVKLGLPYGLGRLRHASRAAPEAFGVHERLIKAYILKGELRKAAKFAEMFTDTATHPRLFLVAASIRSVLGERERCVEILGRGLEFFPSSTILRKGWIDARN